MNNSAEAKVKIGFKQTEVGLIPEDWEVKALSEAVEFLDGKRRPIKSNERISGELPYYGASGIIDYVNDYIFNDELILLGEDGENILSRSLPLVFIVKGKVWVNNHAHVMKPNNDFDIYFLTEFLESLNYSLLNSGTAQPKLNKRSCLQINVPKPPLAEQRAIATALSDVDELINSLEKLIAKKKGIKQGAMQELLGFGSAQPITPRKRLPGFSGEWVERRLGELCKIKSGESPSKFIFEDGDIPFFKVEQLNYGIKYAELTPYYIKHHEPIKAGSIVFPKRRASIFLNKVRIFKHASFLDTNLMSLIVTKELNNVFLFYVLTYQRLDMIADTTSIPQINNKHIIPYLIYMPISIDEQRAIAEALSAMDLEIDSLEVKKEKYKSIKEGMMQELLTGKIRLV